MNWAVVLPDDDAGVRIARELFLEYQAELGIDLCFQGFEEELASLPGKYGPPSGLLLIVWEGARAIACGAVRDLGEGICELKRIYVRPEARRRGIAREMSQRLLEFAREHGYRAARLDTLRRLSAAVRLYVELGFTETEPYNVNPEPDIIYMEMPLP